MYLRLVSHRNDGFEHGGKALARNSPEQRRCADIRSLTLPGSDRRLNIAQIAPTVERVPPKKYGGTERVVHAITEELVKRGHHVTLFASGDSVTSARLWSVSPRSLREAKVQDFYGQTDWTMLQIGTAYAMQDQF